MVPILKRQAIEVSMSRKTKAAEFVDAGYDITVSGRTVTVTEPMKNYAIDKISKIERFTSRILDVNVTMDIQRYEHRVDIIMKLDHVKIKSHGVSENMYASIDKAVDRLEAQIRRYRDRIRDHHAKGLPAVDMNVNVYRSPREQELLDINGDIEEETDRLLADSFRPREIIRQDKMPLKILTFDEAIMKMELSGDPFMLFRNEKDMKLKAIYRDENSGDYCIIEPEA